MGKVRAWAPHIRWKDSEVAVLLEHFLSVASVSQLVEKLPGLQVKSICAKAASIGLRRERPVARTKEEVLKSKAAYMKRRRKENPELMRRRAVEHWARNRERLNAKARADTTRRIFWARALRLRNGISARELASLWKKQRGRCALSGQRMGRDAETDHRLPRARGGKDSIENLQWVTRVANRAKRDLTDEEFLLLCQQCAAWMSRPVADGGRPCA